MPKLTEEEIEAAMQYNDAQRRDKKVQEDTQKHFENQKLNSQKVFQCKITLDKSMSERLKKEAADQERTLNGQILYILKEYLRQK